MRGLLPDVVHAGPDRSPSTGRARRPTASPGKRATAIRYERANPPARSQNGETAARASIGPASGRSAMKPLRFRTDPPVRKRAVTASPDRGVPRPRLADVRAGSTQPRPIRVPTRGGLLPGNGGIVQTKI